VRSGDVVRNPLTGEKAMLVESAKESGGARIVTDFAVEAGGFVPGGEHVHDVSAEHLEVKAGRIAFVLEVPKGGWASTDSETQIRERASR
jgi:hypothetical protein